jgi:HK97 family phage prohead protease
MSETKTLRSVEVKDAEQGIVEAIFATLNVKDSDGDVTVPGAFEDGAPTRISAYGHATWGGALPVGKGTIHEEGDVAICRAQFFMNTQPGRDTFLTIKEMGDLQEWSYGFDILESEEAEHEGEKVRVLKKLAVFEVSPVLLGAGVDTRTVVAKHRSSKQAMPMHHTETMEGDWDAAAAVAKCDGEDDLKAMHAWVDPEGDPDAASSYKFPHHEEPGGPANLTACVAGIAALNGGRGGASIPDGDRDAVWKHLAAHLADAEREPPELRARVLTFNDEADHALARVISLQMRATSLAGMRAKEGRVLSSANRDRLATLLSAMAEAGTALRQLLEETDPGKSRTELLKELARYQRAEAALLGGVK